MATTHHIYNKMNIEVSKEQTDKIIDLALAEDISHGDVTSDTLIPSQLQGRASILAKEAGILAGGDVAKRVFLKVDPSLEVASPTAELLVPYHILYVSPIFNTEG